MGMPGIYDQDSFRIRTDNGSESTAPWYAAANTNYTINTEVVWRLRFLVQETGGGSDTNIQFQLQYNLGGAGWNDVNASSSVVRSVASNLTDGGDTTQQLGAGTFVTNNNGQESSDGLTTAASNSGNDEFEFEFALQFQAADVADGNTCQFRLLEEPDVVLSTYTNTPTVTIEETAAATAAGGNKRFILPTTTSIRAKSASMSAYPALWKEFMSAWVPAFGHTQDLIGNLHGTPNANYKQLPDSGEFDDTAEWEIPYTSPILKTHGRTVIAFVWIGAWSSAQGREWVILDEDSAGTRKRGFEIHHSSFPSPGATLRVFESRTGSNSNYGPGDQFLSGYDNEWVQVGYRQTAADSAPVAPDFIRNGTTTTSSTSGAGGMGGTADGLTIGSGDTGETHRVRAIYQWRRQLSDAEIKLLYHDWLAPFRLKNRVFGLSAVDPTLAVDAGAYILSGQNIDLLYGRRVDTAAGAYTLTGQDISLDYGRRLDTEAGSYTLSGQDIGLLKDWVTTAEQGSYILSGQDVGLLKSYHTGVDAGSYTLSGQAVELLRGIVVAIDTGSYTLSGQDVTLTYSGSDPTLDVGAGSYTLTGQAVDLLRGWLVSTDAGSYTLSGQAVSLLRSLRLDSEAGSYTLSGQDAGLLRGLRLDCEAGAYTLSGQDVTLTYSGTDPTVDVGTGSFTLTGQDVTLLRSLVASVDAGSYTLSGQAVSLLRSLRSSIDAGSYTLTGQAVSLLRAALVPVEAGAYTLNGRNVTLTYSGTITHQDIVLTNVRMTLARGNDTKITLARGSETKMRT